MLDVARVERIVEEVRELTGSAQTAFTVAVLPRVQVAGTVGDEPVDETFAPALTFDLSDLRLQPNLEAGDGVGPLAPREVGSGTQVIPATISFGALSLSISTARRVSLLGIAALLLLTGLTLVARRRRGDGDEHDQIHARYGNLLVPVSARQADARQVTDVSDFDALVRLSLHHGKLILHSVEGGDRSYFVDDGNNVYRYRVEGPEPVTMVWPPVSHDARAGR